MPRGVPAMTPEVFELFVKELATRAASAKGRKSWLRMCVHVHKEMTKQILGTPTGDVNMVEYQVACREFRDGL